MMALAIVVVAYFAAVIALAVVGYRRTQTASDFIVAGRSLGALVGGATLAATQISAGTFVGTVGLHYMAGVCFAWVWPGAWLGWQSLPLIILLSAFTGAVVGIALIAIRGRDRNIPIPFGPYLAAAGWIALMWGDQLLDSYLRISGIRG